MTPRLEALAEEFVERVVAAGPPVDLVETLAAPLPVAVIGEMVGIEPARHTQFRELVDAAVATDPMTGDPAVAEKAWGELAAFVAELVAARRKVPDDDLLDNLIAVRDTDDGRLDDEELVALVGVLVAAGR